MRARTMGPSDAKPLDLVETAAGIVCSYVSNTTTPAGGLSPLIDAVHATLVRLTMAGTGPLPGPTETTPNQPTRAQIRKSVTDDGIVSFIDGKTYTTLKRHLRKHGLDPADYRRRYGLPDDYPMVAPGYSARRSELAKSMGLGRIGNVPKIPGAGSPRARASA